MKKIFIAIVMFCGITQVNAESLNGNMTGITVTPTVNSSSDSECNSRNYWIGFTQPEYKLQGLRISVYDESGKQVGNTIDTWTWGDGYAKPYNYGGFSGTGEKIEQTKYTEILKLVEQVKTSITNLNNSGSTSWKSSNADVKALKDLKYYLAKKDSELTEALEGSIGNFANNRSLSYLNKVEAESTNLNTLLTNLVNEAKRVKKEGFSVYITKKNHSRNYLSKVDYVKKGITAKTAKNFKPKDMIDGGYYVFYYDETGNKDNYSNSYYVKGKKVTEYFGTLLYSSQDAVKTELRTYLTTESVMERYLKLAQANTLVDIKAGDYTVLLEPLVSISACIGGTYSGRYSVSDIGYLMTGVTNPSVNPNNNLQRLPGWLKLESALTISGVSFSLDTSVANKMYNKGDFISKLGVGMSAILGTEVCKENCTSGKKYKVVYHTIDLNNPFLSSNGNTRKISNESNWCEEPSSTSNTCKTTYSINKNIYSQSPILIVTLTPSSISKIRESNKTIDYSKINNETCKNFWTTFKNQSIFSPSTNFCK